jgi:uncharacterized membrane protein YfcA
MTTETLAVAVASIVAGGIASVTGFGIGSVLTPTLSLWMDARLAVAAVSIPHLLGTAVRFWMVKGHVDRHVMWRFGIASAAGGLGGALLQGTIAGARILRNIPKRSSARSWPSCLACWASRS